MFNKKKCKNCGNKSDEKNKFCSNCGFNLSRESNQNEDWGLLGKDDSSEDFFGNSFFNGFTGNMLNKFLGSTMKMFEKEMQKMQNVPRAPRTNFELFINGKRINPQNIKVTKNAVQKQPARKESIELPSKKLKDFVNFPQETPKTNVRRLSDKVIYEIEIPGVKSIENVSINQIGNSIEIKAVSKDKAYFKIINIALPITNYNLEKDKLVLELGVN
ncbi:MAG: zinc-ribbon domain-containing protein [Nanoarchaeota archaeon]|nr:zinc-ribbon domain-containing protein [Nanoarchaeota archaeon]